MLHVRHQEMLSFLKRKDSNETVYNEKTDENKMVD